MMTNKVNVTNYKIWLKKQLLNTDIDSVLGHAIINNLVAKNIDELIFALDICKNLLDQN